MLSDNAATAAIEAGRISANQILAFRKRELRKRAGAISAAGGIARSLSAQDVAPERLQRVGPNPIATLVAEGDSWFDYPMHDVLRYLEDGHGYEVESVAHMGDSVEQMAYSTGQLEEFARRLEKVLRRGVVPLAILLSGGGNDFAGSQFGMLLNHSQSPIAGLNGPILEGVVHQRLKTAYVTILSAVSELSFGMLGVAIPIVIHGYDYPYPDGRGFAGGWSFLPGPWLEPGFRQKGFTDLAARRALIVDLIDGFNEMLRDITELPAFRHVRYVDLRGTLCSKSYRSDWANELHPTAKGFQQITNRLADVLATLS